MKPILPPIFPGQYIFVITFISTMFSTYQLFSTNFISVSRSTTSLNSALTFTSTHCLIYGTYILMNIDAPKLHQSVYSLIFYLFKMLVTPNNDPLPNIPIINNGTLWKNRLSHPSYDTLLQINKKFLCTLYLNCMILVMFVFVLNKNASLSLIV